jgi:hypothetical protein
MIHNTIMASRATSCVEHRQPDEPRHNNILCRRGTVLGRRAGRQGNWLVSGRRRRPDGRGPIVGARADAAGGDYHLARFGVHDAAEARSHRDPRNGGFAAAESDARTTIGRAPMSVPNRSRVRRR